MSAPDTPAPTPPEEAQRLQELGIVRIRAENPSLLTLSGTNTWLVESGADGGVVLIDPGPALPDHLARMEVEIERRGGLRGVALTHSHADHAEAVPWLLERHPDVPLGAFSPGGSRSPLREGDRFGPLAVREVPGHAPDHLVFVRGEACFTGDAVLGEGSVFVAPGHDSLAGYLAALERLLAVPLVVLCPGHGPPVWDPAGKLRAYLAHRRAREGALLAALGEGRRSTAELLDAVWDDVPAALRPAAAITLAAHLEKLEAEGRLPEGVQGPVMPNLGEV
jgi:glyoxylase-like metal-dependent hydrolase (beta-lactamase superfamily II)